MTTLYLMRHGETVDNVRQIMQGQTDGCLTPVGFEQVRQAALLLLDTHFDAVVSSDLHRAVQTAETVLHTWGNTSISLTQTPLLRERDWGDFTGRFIPSLKGLPFPANVESRECLLNRARQFLDFVCCSFPHQCVLAVGHGIINKAIQSVHFQKPMRQIERMTNAEVRVIKL